MTGWQAVIGAQFLDTTTFAGMVSLLGINAEGNPLIAHLYATLGLPGTIIAKVALVAMVLAVTFAVRPSHRNVASVVIVVAVIAGLFGTLSNLLTIGGL